MKKFIGSLCLIFLAACNLSQPSTAGTQVGIDSPADAAILPLAPSTIIAHASDPLGVAQIEFSVNGAVIGNANGADKALVGQQAWTPPAAGQYLIQVRAKNASGTWSGYAQVRVTVQGQEAASPEVPTETSTPESTDTPTASPAPTATETPSIPTLTLIQNANCRRGPSQVYEVLTSLLKGQSVPITAQSEQNNWFLVHIPSGEYCWISGVTGTTAGNVEVLPIATAQYGCFVLDAASHPVCTIPCPQKTPNPADQCTP